ncbi:MAG: pyridoxal phosphate-dependent aminotransferase family protein [Chloroflexi bacterium]|nr:pyridoxal phosphate-dependent aminotransferase family protein [Chloroflexota bacterium]
MQSPVGPRVVFDGREFDYFAGCSYLGLQGHPEVLQAAIDAIRRYGVSTATSRGGYGEHPIYDELEQEACAYFNAEKLLYFATGYLGPAILVQAGASSFDHIFIDSDAHFSLWDAAQAVNKPVTPFHHLQPESLAEKLRLELRPGKRPLVLSDGLFPISGEIAPLPAYLELLKPYNGQVYLDDAHAVGVLGEHGWGTPEYFSLQDDRCRTCGTLSKALGGYGGVIWGEAGWAERVDRSSRIYAGASPPPLVAAAASAKALEIARTSADLRPRLWTNVKRARDGLRALGWALPPSNTPAPIICLESRYDVSIERIRAGLFRQGIAVELVRHYTSTPPGGALRIAVFAAHTSEQIDRLVEGIKELV